MDGVEGGMKGGGCSFLPFFFFQKKKKNLRVSSHDAPSLSSFAAMARGIIMGVIILLLSYLTYDISLTVPKKK